MCKICKDVNSIPAGAALAQIEAAIKAGKDPEHFKLALDAILGTKEPEVDRARDAVWERSHRGRSGN